MRRQSSASAAPNEGASDLDRGRGNIQLVHFSVREFPLAVTLPQPDCNTCLVFFKDRKPHNTHLATVCLRYLQLANVWRDECGELSMRPFTGYAAENWNRHVSAGIRGRHQPLQPAGIGQ